MITLLFAFLFWFWVYKPFLCFLSREEPLAFVEELVWVLKSLSFVLSVKLLISPSYLNEILAVYSNLVCRLFSFITLSMSCNSLLAWRVSIERSAVILMGIPLWVICCFSLSAFNICSLCLIFLICLICVLCCFALGLSCLGFSRFLDLGGYFLPHFREIFNYYLLKYFSWSFFLSSSSGTPMIQMLGHLTLSWMSLRLSSFLLIRFSFFLSDSFISIILSLTSLILSSASVILLLVPSRVFLISVTALFIIDWLFFISSRAL